MLSHINNRTCITFMLPNMVVVCINKLYWGAGMYLGGRAPGLWLEGRGVRSPAGTVEFSSPWHLFRYPFSPPVIAIARKRPRLFRLMCRWQLNNTSLTQRCQNGLTVVSKQIVGTHQGNGLTPHPTRQETLVHDHLRPLSYCGLIRGLKESNWSARADLHLLKKRKRKGQSGNDSLNLSQKYSHGKEQPHKLYWVTYCCTSIIRKRCHLREYHHTLIKHHRRATVFSLAVTIAKCRRQSHVN